MDATVVDLIHDQKNILTFQEDNGNKKNEQYWWGGYL